MGYLISWIVHPEGHDRDKGTAMIDVTEDGGVALVTMNRPAQRNAMSADLVRGLIDVALRLDAATETRAIVLTGAPPGFCAGSDLAGLAGMTGPERSQFESESGRLARLLGQVSKPVVAAVASFAIGGGLTLATSCDIVVTDRGSRWSLPEVPIGLFPAWGMASVVDRVGKAAARRLAWGIDTVDGAEAHRLGLADQLADGDVLAAALAIARRLAALPSVQSACVKEYFVADARGEEADLIANRLFMRTAATEEAELSFRKFAAKAAG
jgi:enoyl-CoA hydratase